MYVGSLTEEKPDFSEISYLEGESSLPQEIDSFSSHETSLLPSYLYNDAVDEYSVTSLSDPFLVTPTFLAESIEPIQGVDSVFHASLIVQDQLTGMAANGELEQIFDIAFGEGYDRQIATSIHQRFRQGDFDEFPLINVVSSSILGQAEGAYAAQSDSIFLSDELVFGGDVQAIAAVILEEFGHAIDSRINPLDAPGDEGYIFSQLVQGKSLSNDELAWLRQESDQAWIEYDGQALLIEQSLPTVTLNVTDASAAEVNAGQTRNPGSFTISRTGSTAAALTVNYSVAGSASNGADYSRLPGRVIIPIGRSSIAIPVSVTNDNVYEVSETVRVSLRQNSAYTIGASSAGALTIADNDPAPRIVDTSRNDSLSTASFIGAWQRNISGINGQGFVGSVDLQDFYRFTLASTSNIGLTLSGIGQNGVRLELLRDINGNGFYDSNETLVSDIAYTYRNGLINTALGAGTYFVRVAGTSSSVNTNYTLSLGSTAAPSTIPTDPGSTLGTAFGIGRLTSNRSFRDFVGSVDPIDTYRFTLANTSSLALTLSGIGQNGSRIELIRDINGNGFYDSNERLSSDIAYTYRNGLIETALGAGTYFIQVSSPYNYVNTNYTLSLGVIATPPTTSRDPGNTLGTALNLGQLTTSRSFQDFVGSVDPIDTYRFTLASTKNVALTLSGIGQNSARIELIRDINGNGFYDSNERLDSDFAYTYRNGVINTTLGAGVYFVSIISPYDYVNTNYTLSLGVAA